MNAFYCRICFPSSAPPSPPPVASNVSLLGHHLHCHPLPPFSKELPRMKTGTGGGALCPRSLSPAATAIISPIPSPGQHLGVPCYMMTTPSHSWMANQVGMTTKTLEGRISTTPFIILALSGANNSSSTEGGGHCNSSHDVIPALLILPDYCRCPSPPIIVVWDSIAPSSSNKEAICPDSVQNNNTLLMTREPQGQTLFTASTNAMKSSRDTPRLSWHSSAMPSTPNVQAMDISKPLCLWQ